MPMFSPPMTKKLYAKLGNGKKVLIKEYNSNNGGVWKQQANLASDASLSSVNRSKVNAAPVQVLSQEAVS